jgi:hypothetical protein
MTRRGRLALLAVAVVLILSAGTTLSYYVDALWFSSLGYSEVFWRTLNFQAYAFLASWRSPFSLYGAFLLFKPGQRVAQRDHHQRPASLPMEPRLHHRARRCRRHHRNASSGVMAEWPTLALACTAGPGGAPDRSSDAPSTYLFTLPRWICFRVGTPSPSSPASSPSSSPSSAADPASSAGWAAREDSSAARHFVRGRRPAARGGGACVAQPVPIGSSTTRRSSPASATDAHVR